MKALHCICFFHLNYYQLYMPHTAYYKTTNQNLTSCIYQIFFIFYFSLQEIFHLHKSLLFVHRKQISCNIFINFAKLFVLNGLKAPLFTEGNPSISKIMLCIVGCTNFAMYTCYQRQYNLAIYKSMQSLALHAKTVLKVFDQSI